VNFDQYDQGIADGIVRAHEAAQPTDSVSGWLGVRVRDIGPGLLRVVVPVRPDLLNPFGNMHGGVLAALCDHVLGMVCYPVMAKGAWAATTEFKLNYLAPVSRGELVATATIVSMTKRTAVAQIEVDNEGRRVCLAQGTVLLMPPREAS
jgi:uncharacterized protein (TIGR00369 family)